MMENANQIKSIQYCRGQGGNKSKLDGNECSKKTGSIHLSILICCVESRV